MEVKELIQDHTSLSDAMRKHCRGFPIYRIEPAEESISVTTISDGGKLNKQTNKKNPKTKQKTKTNKQSKTNKQIKTHNHVRIY